MQFSWKRWQHGRHLMLLPCSSSWKHDRHLNFRNIDTFRVLNLSRRQSWVSLQWRLPTDQKGKTVLEPGAQWLSWCASFLPLLPDRFLYRHRLTLFFFFMLAAWALFFPQMLNIFADFLDVSIHIFCPCLQFVVFFAQLLYFSLFVSR